MTVFFTIGHGAREVDEIAALLTAHGVATLVDVRSHRNGVRQPHLSEIALAETMTERGLHYLTIPDLGGRRKRDRLAGDVNAGWKLAAFRNYADYSLTGEYSRGIRALEAIGEVGPLAYMCSEIVPWRCHRLLISNTLTARGHEVRHIVNGAVAEEHRIGAWGAPAHVENCCVTYPKGAS